MRTVQRESNEMDVDGDLAAVAAEIAALFARCNMLAGFSVQDRTTLAPDRQAVALDGDLWVADVSVDAWPDSYATPALYEEIAQAIGGLLDEHPEAAELLRGNTFARTFH